MDEFLKPVVVLEKISIDHINFGVTSDMKALNHTDNAHIYVNMTPKMRNTIPINTEDQAEEPLTKNAEQESCSMLAKMLQGKGCFLKEKTGLNSPLRSVSFSKQSSILYYSEDQVTKELSDLEVSYINHLHDSPENRDTFTEHQITSELPDLEVSYISHSYDTPENRDKFAENQVTSELSDLEVNNISHLHDSLENRDKLTDMPELTCSVPTVKSFQSLSSDMPELTCTVPTVKSFQSSDIEVKHPEHVSDIEQCLPHKELVITLERLPVSILKGINNENYIPRECSHSSATLIEKNIDNYLNSQLISNQEKKLTGSAEIILSGDQALENDVPASNAVSADLLFDGNTYFLPELKVSLQRLPDDLLELHLNNSAKNSEEIIYSESQNSGSKVVSSEDRLESTGLYTSTIETMTQNSAKELKFRDHGLLTDRKKSTDHNSCDIFMKSPFVQLERLNLVVPEVEDNQHVKGTLLRKLLEENSFFGRQDDINDNAVQTKNKITLPLKASSKKSHMVLNNVPATSKGKKKLKSCHSNGFVNNKSYHAKNNICSPEVDVLALSHWSGKKLGEQARLSCMSNRKISETYIPTENPGYISDMSSSEDDMPLSQFPKLNNTKQLKVPTSLKKNDKKKSQKNISNTVCQNIFNDFNVLHFTGMSQPHTLTSTPKAKKKIKKIASQTSGINKHSNKEMILYSHLPNMNKPDSVTLLAKVKKASKKSHSLEKCQNSRAKKCIPSEDISLLPHLTKINCIDTSALVTKQIQVPSCENAFASNLQSVITDHCYYGSLVANTGHNSNISPQKMVKLDHNYDLSCNLFRQKQNKLLTNHVKNNISSGATSVISKAKTTPKGKKRKKKHDIRKGKKKKTPDDPDVFLKTYLQKFCSDFDELGNDGRENENTCSASDSSRQKKQPDKEAARKKKEKAYKLIISKLHDHIKETCSVKKTFKRPKKQEAKLVNVNMRSQVQLPFVKVESENNSDVLLSHSGIQGLNVSEISPQPTSSEMKFTRSKRLKKRKRQKKCLGDKYRLGLLTGNRSLRLYNKCLASERLLLSKYKMKKEQRKKLKKMFNSLKNNTLNTNEL